MFYSNSCYYNYMLSPFYRVVAVEQWHRQLARKNLVPIDSLFLLTPLEARYLVKFCEKYNIVSNTAKIIAYSPLLIML
jgi:hypothetical protein